MTVYLLHFDRPFGVIGPEATGRRFNPGDVHPTQHYLGFAGNGNLRKRLEEHGRGRGSRLTAVAVELGVGFTLVRTWPEGSRTLERYLKQRNGTPSMCPVCNPLGNKLTAGLHIDARYWDPWAPDPLGREDHQGDYRYVVWDRAKVRRPSIRFRFDPQEVSA